MNHVHKKILPRVGRWGSRVRIRFLFRVFLDFLVDKHKTTEEKLILPRYRDGLESSVFKLGTGIPGGCPAAASPPFVSRKLSTYPSSEVSLLCPGKTVHRQTSSTHVPVVPMSRSLGKHPQQKSESSES